MICRHLSAHGTAAVPMEQQPCFFALKKKGRNGFFTPLRPFPIEKNEPVMPRSIQQPEINFALLHAIARQPYSAALPTSFPQEPASS